MIIEAELVGRYPDTGWWLLCCPALRDGYVNLPTFILPLTSRPNMRVRLERVGGDMGFWRLR